MSFLNAYVYGNVLSGSSQVPNKVDVDVKRSKLQVKPKVIEIYRGAIISFNSLRL